MPNTTQSIEHAGTAQLKTVSGAAVLEISGDWFIGKPHTMAREVCAQISDSVKKISFDASKLGAYDSSLISLILKVVNAANARKISVDFESLPEGIEAMLSLAVAVPAADTKKKTAPIPFVNKVGEHTINMFANTKDYVSFFGDITIALFNLLRGRARMRRSDFMLITQRTGPEALGIVGLISFLVGLILAFVGSIQLAKYGSEIFIADLVGIAMVREMGAMMVGIVMGGRTGAAFTAELGSLKVNEEI